MNAQPNLYSSSADSNEIWSSSPHFHQSSPHFHQSSPNYDAWNFGLQRTSVLGSPNPSKLSWEDVGSFSSQHTKNRKSNTPEVVNDSLEEEMNGSNFLEDIAQQYLQTTSSAALNNDHDLIRSVDQLLLDDDGPDDGGDIFEFDMEDSNNVLYGTPSMGRQPNRRRISCKFYQSGNCKAGNKCRFLHEPPAQPLISPNLPTSPPIALQSRTTYSASPIMSNNAAYGINSNGIKYCKFYDNGFCRHGENCPYSHSRLDLPQHLSASFDQAYPSLFGYQHSLFHSPINSNSAHSSSLPMPHTEFSPGTSPPLSDSSISSGHDANTSSSGQDANAPKACPFFLKGDCRYGDRCRNMHVRGNANGGKKKLINEESLEKFAKIPCKYYRQGHCPFGDACYYLHVDHSNPSMYQVAMYHDDGQQN